MKYKILIVDDEKANLRLLERVLSADYEIIVSESGADAIEILVRESIAADNHGPANAWNDRDRLFEACCDYRSQFRADRCHRLYRCRCSGRIDKFGRRLQVHYKAVDQLRPESDRSPSTSALRGTQGPTQSAGKIYESAERGRRG